jgi:TRAP-type uncharacterized transport system fused permease subunit
LGFSAFVVPFLFIYHHELILKGPLLAVVQASVSATLGVIIVSMAFIGTSYLGNIRWNMFQRVLFFVSFLTLTTPGTFTDLIGVAAFAIGVISNPTARKGVLNLLRSGKKKNKAQGEL